MTPSHDLADLLEACRSRARRVNDWETRKQLAEAHEECVKDMVRQAGWVCDNWGQGMLTDDLRAALRPTKSPLRWAPDLLAVRGQTVTFIDAKSEIRQDTPNFSIERRAFASHFSWWVGNSVHFIYVWDDFRCSHIKDINALLNAGHVHTGIYQGSGSGTPFLLVPKASTRSFDSVFANSSSVRDVI